MTTPDPTDKALDATADGGFQAAGTRFPLGLDEMVHFMERGGVLTSYECLKVAAVIRDLRQRLQSFGVYVR